MLDGRGVRVEHGDALTIDWHALLGAEAGWSMVSNLPYNIATPLVVRVLETAPMVDRLLVMVQREVGERLAATAGTEAYGAVSVKIAYYAHAEIAGMVPPTVFLPKPAVDSALVRLVRRAQPPVSVPDVDRLFVLVRAGFATRRKMLRRALMTELGSRTIAVLEPRASIRARAPRPSTSTPGPRSRAAEADARVSDWRAFAKLTLSLRVLRRRVDGFHELDALTVSVSDPHDDIAIELGGTRRGGGITLELSGPAAAGVATGPDNLAVRAAQVLLDRADDEHRTAGVRIALHKRIPAGAGLGGGSADAAAVLVAARPAPRARHPGRRARRDRRDARFRRSVLSPRRRARTCGGEVSASSRRRVPDLYVADRGAARSRSRPRPSTGPGTTSTGPSSTREVAGSGRHRRAHERPRVGRRTGRAAARRLPHPARTGGRRARDPRRERLGLRGPLRRPRRRRSRPATGSIAANIAPTCVVGVACSTGVEEATGAA